MQIQLLKGILNLAYYINFFILNNIHYQEQQNKDLQESLLLQFWHYQIDLIQITKQTIYKFHQNQMFTSNVSKKAQQFHREVAKKQRMQIIARHRQKLIQSYHPCPLKSDFLQKYWQIPASKLYLHQDEIFDTLDEINGQQLSEQQSSELCHDLLYLLMSNSDFVLPFTMKFRKDESQLTATVVAFAYECLDMQQGNYWLKYMNDDCKNAIYLNIQCGEDVSKWMEDTVLLETVIEDWGHLEEAEGAIGFLLGEVQVGTQQEFIKSVFDKLHHMNKKALIRPSITFLILLTRLMLHLQDNSQLSSYLAIILNESLLKLYNSDPTTQLDFAFLCMIDMLLDKNKNYCRVILNEHIFQNMLKMIANYYQVKFLSVQGVKKMEIPETLTSQKIIKTQSNFINRVIDVCMNQLRIHKLLNNPISINPNLISIFKPHNISTIEQKYKKLVQFNSLLRKDNEI